MEVAGTGLAASIDAVESLLGTAETSVSCPSGLRVLFASCAAMVGGAAKAPGARALAFSPPGAGAGASRPFSPGEL